MHREKSELKWELSYKIKPSEDNVLSSCPLVTVLKISVSSNDTKDKEYSVVQ